MVAGRILPRVLPTCLEHCVSSWGCRCSAGNVGSWVVRAEPGQGHGCLLGAWFLLLSWHPVTDLFPGPLSRGAGYMSCKMTDSGLFLSLPMPLVSSGILFLRRSFWVTVSFYLPSRLPSSLEPVSRHVQGCAGSPLFSGLPTGVEWGQELFFATRFFSFCSWRVQCKVDFIFLVWFLFFFVWFLLVFF